MRKGTEIRRIGGSMSGQREGGGGRKKEAKGDRKEREVGDRGMEETERHSQRQREGERDHGLPYS